MNDEKLTTGITDTGDNALAAPVTWHFTVQEQKAPLLLIAAIPISP
jgi:hypothetical protein